MSARPLGSSAILNPALAAHSHAVISSEHELFQSLEWARRTNVWIASTWRLWPFAYRGFTLNRSVFAASPELRSVSSLEVLHHAEPSRSPVLDFRTATMPTLLAVGTDQRGICRAHVAQ